MNHKRSGGLLTRKIQNFLLPTLLMNLAVSGGVLLSGILAGNLLGTEGLAVIGLATPILFCSGCVFVLIAVGGSMRVAVSQGGRDTALANQFFTVSLILLLVAGLGMAILGEIFLDPLVKLLGNDPICAPLLKDFLRIRLMGLPFMVLVYGTGYLVRADGQPTIAATALIATNLTAIAAQFFFMGPLALGIQGAAWGLLVGDVTGLFFLLSWLCSRKKRNLRLTRLSPSDFRLLGQIASSGLSASLGQGLMLAKILLINTLLLSLTGKMGVVAFSVCTSCRIFLSTFVMGSTQTTVPIVGALFGEQDIAGLRFALRLISGFLLASSAFCVLFFVLFPDIILKLHGIRDAAELALGMPAIRIFSISLLFSGFSFLMMYYAPIIGWKKLGLAISLCQGLVLVVPAAWYFSTFMGTEGVWWAFVFAEVGTLILILGVAWWHGKRSGQAFSLFLLREQEDTPVHDVSLRATLEDASLISRELIAFAKSNHLSDRDANLLGLLAEEMTACIVEHGNAPEGRLPTEIDILTRITPESLIIRLRDDGAPFQPLDFMPEKADFSAWSVAKKIARNIECARVLGMNSTLIVLDRQ